MSKGSLGGHPSETPCFIYICVMLLRVIISVLLVLGSTKSIGQWVDNEVPVVSYDTIMYDEEIRQTVEKAFHFYSLSSSPKEEKFHRNLFNFTLLLSKLRACNQAIEILQNGLERVEPNNLARRTKYIHTIANTYLMNGRLDSAIKYYSHAIDSAHTHSLRGQTSMYNNLGITYLKRHELDSAQRCFDLAIDNHLNNYGKDSVDNLMASILDNIGLVYLERKNLETAEKYFTLSKRMLTRSKLTALAQYQFRMAQINIDRRNFKVAKAILDTVNISGRFKSGKYRALRRLQLQTMLNYYQGLKDTDGELYVRSMQQAWEDSVSAIRFATLDVTMRHVHKSIEKILTQKLDLIKEKAESDRSLLVATHRKSQLNLQVLVLFSVLVFFVLFAIILGLRRRSKQKNMELKLESLNKKAVQAELQLQQARNNSLLDNLAHRDRDLINLSLEITRKQEWMEELQNKLKAVNQEGDMSSALRTVILDVRQQMQTEELNVAFFSNMNKVNSKFYNDLILKHPRLSQKELELCGLIRLSMTNKDISRLRNITYESVKKARKRVRKKLGLKPDENIVSYLSSF